MSTLLMLDSVDPHAFAGLTFDGLAGYVGGSWPDFSPEVALYPPLATAGRIISIAVNASENAEFLDCETGDAVPADCGPWIDRQLARNVWRPGIYANASVWNAGLAADLHHYGTTIRRWVADWVYRPELLPGFDAQQWTDRYLSRNIDGSQVLEDFFAPAPQPPHVNPVNYDWFPDGKFVSPYGILHERELVVRYDEVRKTDAHPAVLEAKLHWLARRVAFEAIHAHPLPAAPAWGAARPSWSVNHRGWRYAQLIHRSQGRRFV